MKKNFFLVDSTLYAYRSFYIVNYKKKYFNYKQSCYVFLNMIYSKFKIYKPDYIIFIFDYNRKNFRHKIYKNYKSNRKKMSKNLIFYIKNIKRFLYFLGIKIFSLPNFEGDDIIASLAYKINQLFSRNCYIYILSYDKDFLQLISKNIYLFIKKDIIIDQSKVFNKYGIHPNLMIDFLVLCGDKSDNIPGIKGVGFKKAIYLLKNIGNIYDIHKNLNKIKLLNLNNKKNIIKIFKNNFHDIKLWYKLISLKCDINLNKINIEDYSFKNLSFKNFFNLLVFFKFH